MKESSIKKFAVESRKSLIENIKYNASLIGITKDDINDPIITSEGIETYLTPSHENHNIYNDDIIKRKVLVKDIKNRGFNTVIDEVANTWFSRIIAIRFMEVNDYLPTKTRVLSSDTPGKNDPDIIKEALDLDLDLSDYDKEKYFKYRQEDRLEELFNLLFFKQCYKLNDILPGLFEKEDTYNELLLDFSFVKPDGIIQLLINEIPEEDFQDQIEIIGLLFQYYAEARKKDLNKSSKEYIAVSTQTFSNDWLVGYLVDNSLGKYWIERNENSPLVDKLEYYIKTQVTEKSSDDTPVEDLKLFDPCMGSGQILCYAFDIFYQIYLELGYSARQIPELILENNLYGLDVDDFAYQISYFNIMMKARSLDRSFFKKNVTPNLYSIYESDSITNEMIEIINNENHSLALNIKDLKDKYYDAKWLGSLLKIEYPDIEKIEQHFNKFLEEIPEDLSNKQIFKQIRKEVIQLINQTKLLSSEYDFVISNPPYRSQLNDTLRKYIDKNYKNYLESLFSAFIYRNFMFCKTSGYLAMITPTTWMFHYSYAKLREYISEKTILSLVQLGRSSTKKSYTSCAFVMQNTDLDLLSTYISLTDFDGGMDIQKEKFLDATSTITNSTYQLNNNQFNIPGSPLTYWINDTITSKGKTFFEYADVERGESNIKAKKYLRQWYEVSKNKINFDRTFHGSYINDFRWYPFNHGGSFRRWYGNQKFLINWQYYVEKIINKGEILDDLYLFSNDSISWSQSTTGLVSFRYYPLGFVFGSSANSLFAIDNDDDQEFLFSYNDKNYFFDYGNKEYLLGLLNSSISQKFLNILSPPGRYPVDSLEAISIIKDEKFTREIKNLVSENIELCKNDWDDYETSWDFKFNPLIKYRKDTLEDSFKAWQEHKLSDFNKLKSNEERLNEIFAEIYSIDVNCVVDDKDVSITKADYETDIKDLVSYAVGCMFGRYSLDNYGIICADENFDIENYESFKPYQDGIIEILDTEYFEDDIVKKFIEFIEIIFGEKHLYENLDFIADALDKKGKNSKEKIRNYFIKNFYKDHVRKYDKHPIYWQFDSGKENGFKCLIYMHRYNPTFVAKVRIDYLEETHNAIKENIEILENNMDKATKRSEIKDIQDEIDRLHGQLEEINIYDDALSRVANQQIEIDLDDGVQENYKKFQDVEIKSEGKKTKKIDLLKKL